MSWQVVESNLEAMGELVEELDPNAALPENAHEIFEDLKALEEEIRAEMPSLDKIKRQETVKKLQEYRRQTENAKKRLLTGGLGENTFSADPDADPRAVDQHQRNMERLHKAREQLYQSEVASQQTMENLTIQTEQMQRINTNLKETNQELSTSSRLLNHMNKWWRG